MGGEASGYSPYFMEIGMKAKEYFYIESPLYKLEYTARVCARYFSLFFKENFSHLDITQGEYEVMDTIVHSPEISQIDLARLLFKGRSHVTQILGTLEQKKYIKRQTVTKDSRKIRQTILTQKGKDIYNQIKSFGKRRKKYTQMCKLFEEKEDLFVGILDEIRQIITDGETVKFD